MAVALNDWCIHLPTGAHDTERAKARLGATLKGRYRLDAVIGVNGGDLGAPNLEHPPATRGTYSAAASGGGASAGATADGPMQTPED